MFENMFLHAGAGLHGHEYSKRPAASTPPTATNALRAPPLLRSAFAPPKQRIAAAALEVEADVPVPPPALKNRSVSASLPRALSPVVRFREPQDEPPSPAPTTTSPVQEEMLSDSELSDATQSVDGAASTRPARRRTKKHRVHRKSGTTYFLGYPTPKRLGKTKVMQKVLPRLLLQLQKVSEDGRSRPVLEVFPASRIAGPVIAPRLAKRFPGIFGVKRHLGYDDIVLVRRDDDDSSDGADSEGDEELERRRLLAVYSPLKHSDEAEIVLDDGAVWVAKPLPNGSYDFCHVDAEGRTTTARWARRTMSPPTSPFATDTAAAPQLRYTFSIINPLTRRHPVMATLTPSALDVQDRYASVSSCSNQPRHTGRARSGSSATLPNSPGRHSVLASTDGESDSGIGHEVSSEPGRTTYLIDDSAKMLISVTALWVALRNGWSPRYTPSPPEFFAPSSASPIPRSTSKRRNTWSRAQTTHAISDTEPVADGQPSSGRVGGLLLKRYSFPIHPTHTCTDVDQIPSRSSTPAGSRSSTPVGIRPVPRRATSTGAAFMQRHLASSSAAAGDATGDHHADSNGAAALSTRLGRRRGNSSASATAIPYTVAESTWAPAPEKEKRKSCGPGIVLTTASPEVVVAASVPAVVDVSVPGSRPSAHCFRGSETKVQARVMVEAADKDIATSISSPVYKKGMRSKLSRWMHKLGGR